MIVDCYTHIWESPDELGRCLPANGRFQPADESAGTVSDASPMRHSTAAGPVGASFVIGFRSQYFGADIANDRIAAHVRGNRDRLFGFAGLDPRDMPAELDELSRAQEELSLTGIAVAPAAQDFHPTDSHAMQLYAEVAARGMPLLFHTGVHVTASTKLEYARPFLLDEVARELPDLRIVIAHMGYPWVEETIVLLAKHQNVFAEISWLLDKPWQAYQALLSAYQCGVMSKLLFGSGFPAASAEECIEELYGINHLVHGTNLPTVPREQLRGIVERDALSLLGIK